MKRLHGAEAIKAAERHGYTLSQFSLDHNQGDPDGITIAHARKLVGQGMPELVYIDVPDDAR